MTQPPLMTYIQETAVEASMGRKIGSAAIWFGVAFMSLIVLLGCTGMLLPPIFMIGSPLIVIVLFVSVAAMIRRIRLNRAYATLAYLEAATRLNLPLSAIMTAAAQSERGPLAINLALFGASLQDGFSVATSLGRTMPEVPADMMSEIEAGETIGRLPQTLQRLQIQRRRRFTPGADEQIFNRVYPLFILVFTSAILWLFLIVVLPKFKEIFKDFRVPLPGATLFLMHFTDGYFLGFGSLFVFAAGVLFIGLVGSRLRRIFIVRDAPGLARPVTDWLLWHLPFYGAIVREAELARVCNFLGEALAQGMPLVNALDVAEGIPQNGLMREQLVNFGAAVSQGSTISQAAAAAGFPRGMIELLGPAERTGSVAEALGFLATHYRWRTDRRRTLLMAALQPGMVIAVGSVVGFIAFALFSPLVRLIEATCGLSGSL